MLSRSDGNLLLDPCCPLKVHIYQADCMKTHLDCYPCLLRQALQAVRMADGTEEQQIHVTQATLEELLNFDGSTSPPAVAYRIHQLVAGVTGNFDPYADVKNASTAHALTLYPRLKKLVAASDDRLRHALQLSIAGNIIDFAVSEEHDLEASIDRALSQPLEIDKFAAFRSALGECQNVLYLADNAGETVFDRILIEALDRPVDYVVKAYPILNDATLEDALAAGIGKVATILDNGSGAPGTLLDDCSPQFRRRFEESELVIAKGQANYETLRPSNARVFFLFQVKCDVISRELDAPIGSMVIARGGT